MLNPIGVIATEKNFREYLCGVNKQLHSTYKRISKIDDVLGMRLSRIITADDNCLVKDFINIHYEARKKVTTKDAIPGDATHFVKYNYGQIVYFKEQKYFWVALVDGKTIPLSRKPPRLEAIYLTQDAPHIKI